MQLNLFAPQAHAETASSHTMGFSYFNESTIAPRDYQRRIALSALKRTESGGLVVG